MLFNIYKNNLWLSAPKKLFKVKLKLFIVVNRIIRILLNLFYDDRTNNYSKGQIIPIKLIKFCKLSHLYLYLCAIY